MCGFKNMFWSLMNQKVVMLLLEMSRILVNGKDKITIRLKNGKHQFIPNVYFVLDMKNNILSLG